MAAITTNKQKAEDGSLIELIETNEKEIIRGGVEGETTDPVPASDDEKPERASFALSINMDLLNTELCGVFERKKISDDQSRLALLIIPTDKPKGGMTLMQLVLEVNTIISSFTGSNEKVSEEQIKQSLNSFKLLDLNAISLELRQVFLYYTRTSSTAEGSTEPAKTHLEYAVNFTVTSKVEPDTDLKLFKFKSLSAGIWNTTRPQILERMTLGSVEDLLK